MQNATKRNSEFIGTTILSGLVRLAAVITIIVLPASICSASAADLYFAQTAIGSSNGTSCGNAYAYNDGTHGINVASSQVAGNTLHLCGTITGAANQQLALISHSGANGNPITIKFETGASLSSPAWYMFGAIQLYNVSWVVVDGGTNGIIQNTQNGTGLMYAQDSEAVNVTGGANVTIKNLTIANICQHTSSSDTTGCQTSGNTDRSIEISGGATNVTVTQIVEHDSFVGVFYLWQNGDSGVAITNNTLSRNNWGINAGGTGTTATGLKISNNDITCSVNATCNWDDGAGNDFHHNGMIIDPINTLMNGMVVSNNYIHDVNPATGFVFLDPTGSGDLPGVQVYNNIGYTSPGQAGPANAAWQLGIGISNALVANNTVVGPCSQAISGQVSPTIKNNIVSSVDYGILLNSGYSGVVSDYNDFYNLAQGLKADTTLSGSLSAWQSGTGLDTHSISGNPNITAAFTLNAGSPAIGAGTNLTSLGIAGLDIGAPQTFGVGGVCGTGCVPRPSSGAWDMGAYQHSTGSSTSSTQSPNPPSGLVAVVQ